MNKNVITRELGAEYFDINSLTYLNQDKINSNRVLPSVSSAISSDFKVFRATPLLNVTNIEDHMDEQINQDTPKATENGS